MIGSLHAAHIFNETENLLKLNFRHIWKEPLQKQALSNSIMYIELVVGFSSAALALELMDQRQQARVVRKQKATNFSINQYLAKPGYLFPAWIH